MWLCVINGTVRTADGTVQVTEQARYHFGTGSYVVGRPAKAGTANAPDIAVPGDASVSKQHCTLVADATTVGGLRIVDSSRFGSTVNSTKLASQGTASLAPNDQVMLTPKTALVIKLDPLSVCVPTQSSTPDLQSRAAALGVYLSSTWSSTTTHVVQEPSQTLAVAAVAALLYGQPLVKPSWLQILCSKSIWQTALPDTPEHGLTESMLLRSTPPAPTPPRSVRTRASPAKAKAAAAAGTAALQRVTVAVPAAASALSSTLLSGLAFVLPPQHPESEALAAVISACGGSVSLGLSSTAAALIEDEADVIEVAQQQQQQQGGTRRTVSGPCTPPSCLRVQDLLYAILTQDVYMPRAAFQAASHAVQQQHAAHMHVSDDDISDDITEEAEEELDPAVQGMHAVAASRLHTHPAGGSAPPPPAIGSVPLLPLHPQQQVQPNKGPLLQQQHKEPSQQQQQAEGPPRGSLIPTRQALVHTAIAPAAAAPAAASHLQLAPASRTQAGQQGVAAPCSTAAAAASGAPAGAAAVGAVVTAAAAAGMVQDAAGDADGWCRLTQRPFDAQIVEDEAAGPADEHQAAEPPSKRQRITHTANTTQVGTGAQRIVAQSRGVTQSQHLNQAQNQAGGAAGSPLGRAERPAFNETLAANAAAALAAARISERNAVADEWTNMVPRSPAPSVIKSAACGGGGAGRGSGGSGRTPGLSSTVNATPSMLSGKKGSRGALQAPSQQGVVPTAAAATAAAAPLAQAADGQPTMADASAQVVEFAELVTLSPGSGSPQQPAHHDNANFKAFKRKAYQPNPPAAARRHAPGRGQRDAGKRTLNGQPKQDMHAQQGQGRKTLAGHVHDPYAYVEEPEEETNAVYSDADEYGMEEVGGQNGVGDNSGGMSGRGGASSRERPLNGGPFDDQGFPQVKLVLVDPFRTTDDTEAFARQQAEARQRAARAEALFTVNNNNRTAQRRR